jgi:alpha-tubulin suppressor-like RCC1 family protein
MTLNSSGQISIGGSTVGQSINLELGRSATAQSSLNDADLRTLAGIASGQISLSSFYGKAFDSGYLYVWGDGTNGQLGNGSTTDRSSPIQIGSLTNWRRLGGTPGDSLAIKSDGTLWAWGYNIFGQLGVGDEFTKYSPVQVGSDTTWSTISKGGHWFLLATKTNGTLWAWGRNDSGQLGDGTGTNRNSPVQIGSETDWVTVGNGGYASHAIKTNGTLWGWGQKLYGQVGDGSTSGTGISSPVQIGSATNWSMVRGGLEHVIGLQTNGTLWTWGRNNVYQLGIGTGFSLVASPTQVGSDTNWASIDGGYNHSVAVKSTGTLWTWGGNAYGELGLGDTTNRYSPIQVGSDTDWAVVTAGWFCTLAIKTNGTLWAWGINQDGVLGLGDTTNRSSPVQIGSSTNWISTGLRAAGYTVLAVRR